MAQNSETQTQPTDQSEGQIRALISLFNWLVGEVVTARIMILRLAADLVRTGGIAVDDINGSPLAQEIIDSVLSNFPSDPMWQPLMQRLRSSLDTIRRHDLQEEAGLAEDLDDLEELEDLDELPMEAQVIYRHPDQEPASEPQPFPRLHRSSSRSQN